jgi:hypothetical protein
MKKKNIQNVIAIFLGLIFSLILIEILFSTVMPAAELPKSQWKSEYNIPAFKPGMRGHYTFGKFCNKGGKWNINNEGWNSPYDYIKQDKQKIIILGDSYIEAFQVDIEKSLGPVLQSKIGKNYQVMSFGTSGAPLSQYLQFARYAQRKFEPQVMVLNLIHNDFEESIAGEHYSKVFLRYRKLNNSVFLEDSVEKFPEASLRFKILNATATGRYLLHNLKLHETDFISLFKAKKSTDTQNYNANIDVIRVRTQQNDIRKVTEHILLQFQKEFPSVRLILMMDGLRKEIYQGIPTQESNIAWMNIMVKELADLYNIEFVDLTLPFEADFKKNQTHFESPFDWHWNEYGHKIVAESLFKQIISKRN